MTGLVRQNKWLLCKRLRVQNPLRVTSLIFFKYLENMAPSLCKDFKYVEK